jgi:hypothetical protein
MSYLLIAGNSTDDRPISERVAFKSVEIILLLARFVILVVFTFQTIRHVRASLKKNGRTNRYALATFICLDLSYLGFFVYGGIPIAIQFAMYVSDPQE